MLPSLYILSLKGLTPMLLPCFLTSEKDTLVSAIGGVGLHDEGLFGSGHGFPLGDRLTLFLAVSEMSPFLFFLPSSGMEEVCVIAALRAAYVVDMNLSWLDPLDLLYSWVPCPRSVLIDLTRLSACDSTTVGRDCCGHKCCICMCSSPYVGTKDTDQCCAACLKEPCWRPGTLCCRFCFSGVSCRFTAHLEVAA